MRHKIVILALLIILVIYFMKSNGAEGVEGAKETETFSTNIVASNNGPPQLIFNTAPDAREFEDAASY